MNSKKQRRSKLDPHQYLIMQWHDAGTSLQSIKKMLAMLGVEVKSRTTIKNFIDAKKSLVNESGEWLGV